MSEEMPFSNDAVEKSTEKANKVLGVEVNIIRGTEVVEEVLNKLEEMKKNEELEMLIQKMNNELGLNKEITPDQEKILKQWEQENKEKEYALNNIDERKKKPIIENIEKKEVTIKEKVTILKKLYNYLNHLDGEISDYTEGGRKVKDEIKKVKKMIEKLEKDLKDCKEIPDEKIRSNITRNLIAYEIKQLEAELTILRNLRVMLINEDEIKYLELRIKELEDKRSGYKKVVNMSHKVGFTT